MVRVLGIDPGLQHTGWAILEGHQGKISHIDSGTIHTNAKDLLDQRLVLIGREIRAIIINHTPIYAAIEETYVNKNYGSSLKLAHARGVGIFAIAEHNISVAEYSAKTVKKTVCGSGAADKTQIEKMLRLFLPNVVIKSPDQSDAISIAYCHLLHLNLRT